ncbi:transposase [Spirochaetia bacterium]|nr:transposase [Spirochaetia bacterium]GHU31675.1 transposase [Spirochaetia bacterium]
MSRPERGDTSKGKTYHVASEINRKTFDLQDDEDKEMFLAVIDEAKVKKNYKFELHNFCIMDNHFHFLITPELGQSLSVIMKWIKMVVAIRWNRNHEKTGHLWGDRFFSREIVDDEDFITVYNYIDQNPVKAGIVENPEDWPWGGLHHHRIGDTRIVKAAPEWILERLPIHRPLGTDPRP